MKWKVLKSLNLANFNHVWVSVKRCLRADFISSVSPLESSSAFLFWDCGCFWSSKHTIGSSLSSTLCGNFVKFISPLVSRRIFSPKTTVLIPCISIRGVQSSHGVIVTIRVVSTMFLVFRSSSAFCSAWMIYGYFLSALPPTGGSLSAALGNSPYSDFVGNPFQPIFTVVHYHCSNSFAGIIRSLG